MEHIATMRIRSEESRIVEWVMEWIVEWIVIPKETSKEIKRIGGMKMGGISVVTIFGMSSTASTRLSSSLNVIFTTTTIVSCSFARIT